MMTDLVIANSAAAHGIYGELGSELVAKEPPQWARILAAYVRDRGYTAAIVDAEAEDLTPAETAKRIANLNPRLVCIAVYGHQPSSSSQQMWGAGLLAKELAHAEIGPTIMVGGHPSALPRRTLLEEAVDYVGVGEGPLTILGLLRGDDRGAIPGLVYENGHVIQNKAAPLIEDLGELHGNVWDLLPMEKYRAHNWQCFDDLSKRQPYASIYTTLNCPFACSFCCISAPFGGGNSYRMRSSKAVVDEIEMLHQRYGISTLKITDEMFILNQRHYTAICEGIIERGLGDKLNIWGYSRVDTVKPSTLDLLRRAGFRWLALGIESGSKHVRDGADKAMRTEDIVGTVRTIQDHGINVIGNFMFGLRDDDTATMAQTLDLALECMPDFSNFYSCMAYPGSGLYTQAVKEGWKLPKTFAGYSQHNKWCRPLDTEHVDGATVLKVRDEAFRSFFSDPRYLAHIERKFGDDACHHIEQMLQYKLERLLLEPQRSRDELEMSTAV